MIKPLNLPKTDNEGVPYLSYSQVSTWIKSKREYMRQYFFGERFEGNAYTDFGTKVGEALENNDFSGFEPDEQEFLKTVPRYDRFEKEIKLEMDGFYVKGFIDTLKLPDDHKGQGSIIEYVPAIADYKTGDISKKRADYESEDYIQLEIYAADILQTIGSLPERVEVILIGRKGNAFKKEELTLTKEFITISREVSEERVEAVKALVQEVAEDIAKHYELFLKLNK